MLKIGVIGSAGRKDDSRLLNRTVYDMMYGTLIADLMNFKGAELTLVSGGAAYADHLAVRTFLEQPIPISALHLHLPSEFKNSKFNPNDRDGSTANFYHKQMERVTAIDSLLQLQLAIDKGAVVSVSNGFLARNLLVGKVDVLIAFTFGRSSGTYSSGTAELSGLKDGGTAHTWDHSSAPVKIHHNIHELI